MEKLKKLKEFLFGTNVALLGFSVYLVKLLIITPSIAEASIMAVVTGLYGYSMYMKSREPKSLNQTVIEDLENIKAAVNALKLEKSLNKKPAKYF